METIQVMRPGHPRWEEFYSRLAGPEGCDFRQEDGLVQERCDGTTARPFTVAILRSMGLSAPDIRASLADMRRHGGFCDCEVLLNCGPGDEDEEW